MELSPAKVLEELRKQFPLHYTICLQAAYIKHLEEQNDTDDK
jgi:hypothetical protein|tara:strand:+ start:1844 stop:1969 length:126 start_codon:yes stop_codon:yes gene_type:complete